MPELTEIRAKYGGIEKLPDTERGPNYRVSFYPSYMSTGYSTYPSLKMFINGCEEQSRDAIVTLLNTIEAKTAMTLQVARGPVRQSKKDDGEFASYNWNIARLLTIGGAPVKVEAPTDTEVVPPAEASTPKEPGTDSGEVDDGQGPLFPDEPGPADPAADGPPKPEAGAEPTREEAAEIQKIHDKREASIMASWAINQGRETYEWNHAGPDAPLEDPEIDAMLNEIHRLARRYIRMQQHLHTQLQGATK